MDAIVAGMSTMAIVNHGRAGDTTDVYDENDSRLRGDRLADYLRSPLQESLRSVPGVGRVSERMMIQAGVTNTYQLIGKFLEFRATGDSPQQHCNKFWRWLEAHGTSPAHRSTVTHALAEKLNIFMPGMYTLTRTVRVPPAVAENAAPGSGSE